MEFNAFTAGVEPGGLNNIEQIKLLVCYLLKEYGPMTRQVMLEATQVEGLVNYFEMANAINVMLNDGHITETEDEKNNEKILSIMPSGLEIISYLENNLPRSVREKALKATLEITSEIKRRKETVFSFEKTDSGCYINCVITDGELELASIRLLIPDEQAYRLLSDRFILTDPSLIYRSVTALMTGDIEAFTEYFDR